MKLRIHITLCATNFLLYLHVRIFEHFRKYLEPLSGITYREPVLRLYKTEVKL